ncbi:MAG TPA: transglutaminase domain-containing protein [Pyrinomonadaceae bacterium]|jgi:transglutaminase-like putative cysteine protease
MKRFTLVLAALVCGIVFNHLCSVASAQNALRKPARPKAQTSSTLAPRERQFAFEYRATVKEIPAGTRKFDLWIPVPHDTPFQKITSLEIDSPQPYRVHTAEYGNKVLHLSLNHPAPAGFTVTMRFDTLRREHIQARLRAASHTPTTTPREERDPYMARWLAPDRLVPIDGKVREWAQEVAEAAGAKTNLDRARAIYNHVVSTVKYDKSGQGWGRGDIYYACDARRGNCTDFHAIFIGYCRALGIPARFAIGFPLPTDRGAGQVSGYHCWAEFYVEGIGWIPVDASEAAKDPARREYFFGAHDENRVEFTTGRDLVLSPKQQGAPLNYFIYPYAEADGQPLAAIERTFTYRDAPRSAATGSGRE